MAGGKFRLQGGKFLTATDGSFAVAEDCCCGDGECSYEVVASLSWSNDADLDLYGKVSGEDTVYFDNVNGLWLSYSVDAHPLCDESPNPPEEISGYFSSSKTLYFWYDQYSDCETETSPSLKNIRVTNYGDVTICVNGQDVLPDNYWETSTLAYAGYDTSSSPDYSSGTEIEVTCGSCP
jgi:hypothetical protein